MVQKTNIGYADLSSNPIKAVNKQTGKRFHFCTKIQTGCANCYSEAMNLRIGNKLEYYPQNEQFVQFVVDTAELAALQRIVEPSRIFLFDMTDVFHHLISNEQRNRVFSVLNQLTRHTLIMLTKRPGRMADYFLARYDRIPENFWLGTSISTQRDAEKNIPELLRLAGKGAKLILSVEPMLESVCIKEYLFSGVIDWVICGAESGKDRRPFYYSWALFLGYDCERAGVPFFMKQGSAFKPGQQGDIPDPLWSVKQFPEVEG